MKLYKFSAAIAAVALTVGMTACNDDDETYDYPGVSGQVVLSPTVDKSYTIVKTPEAYVAPTIDWEVEVRTRIPAKEQIDVKFEIDNTLIAAYNTDNATEYLALPDGMLTLVVPEPPVVEDPTPAPEPEQGTESRAGNEGVLTVAEGNTKSTVKLTATFTTDQAQLATLDLTKEYIVPVRMTEVVKGDARLAVSSTNISYLTFNLVEAMIKPAGETPKGTMVDIADRQDWTGTPGDGASEYWDWAWPITQGSNYSYGSYPAGSTVTFDFAEEKTFDGIYAYPFYGMSSYSLFRNGSEILTSSDGSTWKSLGVLEGTRTTVAFYAPVTARYVKVVFGNGGSVACTEFTIYAL